MECEHKKTNFLSIFELRFRSRIQHGIEIIAMKIAERPWIHFLADAFTTVFLVVS